MKKIKLKNVSVNADSLNNKPAEYYTDNYVLFHELSHFFYSAADGREIFDNNMFGTRTKQSFYHKNIKIELSGCKITVLFWGSLGNFINSTYLLNGSYILETQSPCVLAVPDETKFITYNVKNRTTGYRIRITGF